MKSAKAKKPVDVCERCAAPINPSDWPLVCCARCGKLICSECQNVDEVCAGYCDA